MNSANTKRLKLACYTINISMSAVQNLSPVLFTLFHNTYGISFSLLGLLVLINFTTQLTVDIIFSFFSHKFNIHKTVKFIPVLTTIGLCVYSLIPLFFPEYTYAGLLLGTIIFSASGGLSEVLISPVITALPSDNPDRELSKLHSTYAWGVVFVIVFSTLFLYIFGKEHWQFLSLTLALTPLVSAILFARSKIPNIQTEGAEKNIGSYIKRPMLWLCVGAIFFGGAAEVTMAQWCSGYLEQGFGIDKVKGDLFGTALLSVMLGLGRTLYTKFGKRADKVILFGFIGAAICYFTAAISNIPLIGLIACAFTGFCTSMLWPGSLMVASDKFPTAGVFIYAIMAAGGDMGAAIGPQLVGIITDMGIAMTEGSSFLTSAGLSPEQFGIKIGILVGVLFPIMGSIICAKFVKDKNKELKEANQKQEE